MTLDEVQKEIDKLHAIKRDLEIAEQRDYDNRCKVFVGKCYRITNGVFKILSIPRKYIDVDFHSRYDKNRFPVLVLHRASWPLPCDYLDDFVPCFCDEIYFDIDKMEMPYGSIEITQEEFNAEFDKCIEHFKEQINV